MTILSFIFIIFISALSINQSVAKDCIPNRNFEFILNGDFELGDTLFHTDYIYSDDGKNEMIYSITTNPKFNYDVFDSCGDHTTGFSKMMLINGDTTAGSIIWGQTVKGLEPDTDYEFSFWITTVIDVRPPLLFITINGDTLKPYPIYINNIACDWQKITYVWNSTNHDTAEVHIYNMEIAKSGNDFALDDISFMPFCRLQVCIGNDFYTCKDKPFQLNGKAEDGDEPYLYQWYPPQFIDDPNSPNTTATINQTTTFVLAATDSRFCTVYDTITVFTYNEPPSNITADKLMPACPCDTVTLTAPAGYNYQWSNGASSQSIKVTVQGTYSVIISDINGCESFGSFDISFDDISVLISTDKINAKAGDKISLLLYPFSEKNLINCGFLTYDLTLSYNASLMIPTGNTPFGNIVNGIETIQLKGNIRDFQDSPLEFIALFGNQECTDIVIDNVAFACDSLNVITANGRLCLTDICYADGIRLFDSDKRSFLNLVYAPNEIILNFGVIENISTTIQIYNSLGQLTSTVINGVLRPGSYELRFRTQQIPKGVYFVVLTNGTSVNRLSFINN